jgi:hypothetical protein
MSVSFLLRDLQRRNSELTPPSVQAFSRRPGRHPRRTLARVALRVSIVPPQVRAIQFGQVEGMEEHVAAFALATKPLEHREPILVAGHGPAVDQARADLRVGSLLRE